MYCVLRAKELREMQRRDFDEAKRQVRLEEQRLESERRQALQQKKQLVLTRSFTPSPTLVSLPSSYM